MNRIVVIFVICLVLFSTCPLHSQVNDIFNRGNSLYMEGNYRDASELYLEIIKNGYESGPLYFNLGNTFYKTGNIEKAILYYEKSKKLMPNDDDLEVNLQMVNQLIPDQINPIPELFYKQYWNTLRDLFGPETWGIFFIISYLLFGVSTSIWIIVYFSDPLSRFFKKISIVMGILILLSAILTYSNVHEKNRKDFAIIMEEKIEIYSEPSESSGELFSLHKGSKIQIKRKSGTWIEIKLADGKVGWIQRKYVEII